MSVLRRQEKSWVQPVCQDISGVITLTVMVRRAVVKSRSTNKANLQKTIQNPQLFSNVARNNATTGAMEACFITFNNLTVC